MILGFKPQFKEPILNGTKIHTIRADKNNRWHFGKLIQFATGVRTKNYHRFKEGVCFGTQKIEIQYDYIQPMGHTVSVKIDDRYLTLDEIDLLAKNDGFECKSEFFEWFDKDFTGKIIHWTKFRY